MLPQAFQAGSPLVGLKYHPPPLVMQLSPQLLEVIE